ncbi:parathymosin-like [Uranotaenia lowii]|uniref:parathymosin-like n=1 Tax=Uranotaenia lowii TaxID=190385 RepID=UPI0024787C77|nr:parathymosin-like [Uranotaenia lowii]
MSSEKSEIETVAAGEEKTTKETKEATKGVKRPVEEKATKSKKVKKDEGEDDEGEFDFNEEEDLDGEDEEDGEGENCKKKPLNKKKIELGIRETAEEDQNAVDDAINIRKCGAISGINENKKEINERKKLYWVNGRS